MQQSIAAQQFACWFITFTKFYKKAVIRIAIDNLTQIYFVRESERLGRVKKDESQGHMYQWRWRSISKSMFFLPHFYK